MIWDIQSDINYKVFRVIWSIPSGWEMGSIPNTEVVGIIKELIVNRLSLYAILKLQMRSRF